MARLPDADTTLLRQIAAWVTDGITLDLVSWPPAANHDNTQSVLLNAGLVRARLQEYMAFGAVVQLPQHANCPFGTDSAAARHHQAGQEATASHRPVPQPQ